MGRATGAGTPGVTNALSDGYTGDLAEYIVGLALGCVKTGTRLEWDACDLRTSRAVRVEVKSSAYLQSWSQQRPTTISFDIRPTEGWDHATNTYATERKRQADVYVFCVFKHMQKETADPLKLDQWDFSVLSTERLNDAVGDQKSITLNSLRRHGPAPASFPELREKVEAAAGQEPRADGSGTGPAQDR